MCECALAFFLESLHLIYSDAELLPQVNFGVLQVDNTELLVLIVHDFFSKSELSIQRLLNPDPKVSTIRFISSVSAA